jgi:hypothetical protein
VALSLTPCYSGVMGMSSGSELEGAYVISKKVGFVYTQVNSMNVPMPYLRFGGRVWLLPMVQKSAHILLYPHRYGTC